MELSVTMLNNVLFNIDNLLHTPGGGDDFPMKLLLQRSGNLIIYFKISVLNWHIMWSAFKHSSLVQAQLHAGVAEMVSGPKLI